MDNTVGNVQDLPRRLKKRFPSTMVVECRASNQSGNFNKGAGDVDSWRHLSPIINEHDFVVQFNPRLRLDHPALLTQLLREPRNLVTSDARGGVKTGYFSLQASVLLELASSINVEQMVNSQISIEEIMHSFLMTKGISPQEFGPLGTTYSGTWGRKSSY
jgi:hypothetical protein